MISPFTKPGTRVVCVDADSSGRYMRPGVRSGRDLHGLRAGAAYTVLTIIRSERNIDGFSVIVDEIVRFPNLPRDHKWQGYSLRRFRPLDLPECLTSLLHTQPHDLEVVS